MNPKENEVWLPHQMYCPSCGTLNTGYKNGEGAIKYQCKRCQVVFVRSYKNRRSDVIEVCVTKRKSAMRS